MPPTSNQWPGGGASRLGPLSGNSHRLPIDGFIITAHKVIIKGWQYQGLPDPAHNYQRGQVQPAMRRTTSRYNVPVLAEISNARPPRQLLGQDQRPGQAGVGAGRGGSLPAGGQKCRISIAWGKENGKSGAVQSGACQGATLGLYSPKSEGLSQSISQSGLEQSEKSISSEPVHRVCLSLTPQIYLMTSLFSLEVTTRDQAKMLSISFHSDQAGIRWVRLSPLELTYHCRLLGHSHRTYSYDISTQESVAQLPDCVGRLLQYCLKLCSQVRGPAVEASPSVCSPVEGSEALHQGTLVNPEQQPSWPLQFTFPTHCGTTSMLISSAHSCVVRVERLGQPDQYFTYGCLAAMLGDAGLREQLQGELYGQVVAAYAKHWFEFVSDIE